MKLESEVSSIVVKWQAGKTVDWVLTEEDKCKCL